MIRNDLRNPIVKTVLLIAFITLIILFSFNAPPGSGVYGTLTAIVSGIFTTIKVIIGLVVAFVVSLFLFIVIFALSVAIISRSDAVKVINSVAHRLIGRDVLPQPKTKPEPRAKTVSPGTTEPVKKQRSDQEGIETYKEEKQELKTEKKEVEARVRPQLEQEVESLQRTKEKLTGEIASLQSRLNQLTDEIRKSKEEQRTAELKEDTVQLKSETDSLKEGVNEIRKDMDSLKKQLAGLAMPEKQEEESPGAVQEVEPETGHRIFEYLTRKADRKKFAELTERTVEQGMSYAEATKFITSNMPDKATEVVEAHPALTREYIKSRRDAAAG